MISLTKTNILSLIKRIDAGVTQSAVLQEEGISYTAWRQALNKHGITWRPKRGRIAVTYSLAVLREVQKRARAGEFIKDICDERGLLYPNLCRACRRAGIKILDPASLRENNRRRNHPGPKRKAGETPKSLYIYAALDAGATARQLTERFDITHSYAKFCRKRHREGAHLATQKRRQVRQQNLATIKTLHKKGLTLSEIGKRIGENNQYVSRLLKQALNKN